MNVLATETFPLVTGIILFTALLAGIIVFICNEGLTSKKYNKELWEKCVNAFEEEGYTLFLNGIQNNSDIVLRALNRDDWNYGISYERKEVYLNEKKF